MLDGGYFDAVVETWDLHCQALDVVILRQKVADSSKLFFQGKATSGKIHPVFGGEILPILHVGPPWIVFKVYSEITHTFEMRYMHVLKVAFEVCEPMDHGSKEMCSLAIYADNQIDIFEEYRIRFGGEEFVDLEETDRYYSRA